LGAHYTGEEDIVLIVEPVLMAPLRREWSELQVECGKLREKAEGLSGKKRANAIEKIGAKLRAFADKIAAVKVLDPACGAPRGAIKQYLKGKEAIRKVSSMPQYC
jgi:hypothetical protein